MLPLHAIQKSKTGNFTEQTPLLNDDDPLFTARSPQFHPMLFLLSMCNKNVGIESFESDKRMQTTSKV